MGDQPVARPLPTHRTTQTQNKRTHTPNIHARTGIRTHDHSVRASEDSSCLRPVGYPGRQLQGLRHAYLHFAHHPSPLCKNHNVSAMSSISIFRRRGYEDIPIVF
jgi:hypothetical protein